VSAVVGSVALADGLDHAIARKQAAVGDFAPRTVHRDQHLGITQQQAGHGNRPAWRLRPMS
jgi:hypothetical protein